mmetsp:Transcript_20799/g.62054  ORF Transcript_20799/g.62054 Transcript_20799/m.62054 type:complete len:340 (-) Transcript_20799:1008-2027(-)
MEAQERGPVAHGHVGEARDVADGRVHGRLVGQVERGRGLVQDGQRRPCHEHAGEGEPLLLAQGELVAPIAHGVEVHRLEPAEAGRRERRAELVVADRRVFHRARVAQLLAERAQRAVGPLGQEHGLGRRRLHDLAPAAGPEARERAQQRRLADARIARDEEVAARGHVEGHVAAELAAVGRLQPQSERREHGAGLLRDLHELAGALAAGALHALHEGAQALEARREGRDGLELPDDDGQVASHAGEGAGRLPDDAEPDGAREVAGRRHEHRQDLREDHVGPAGDIQIPLRAQDLPLVVDRARHASRDLLLLLRLAAVEGDALGVLPEPHERVADGPLPH